jgi:DNA-binding LytR/AlgR family response regulator
MPAVVCTTAYDQLAILTFEAQALDHLLKPFDSKRLHHAIERARAFAALDRQEFLARIRISDALLSRSSICGPPVEIKSLRVLFGCRALRNQIRAFFHKRCKMIDISS